MIIYIVSSVCEVSVSIIEQLYVRKDRVMSRDDNEIIILCRKAIEAFGDTTGPACLFWNYVDIHALLTNT
jgi:hypothetical protein